MHCLPSTAQREHDLPFRPAKTARNGSFIGLSIKKNSTIEGSLIEAHSRVLPKIGIKISTYLLKQHPAKMKTIQTYFTHQKSKIYTQETISKTNPSSTVRIWYRLLLIFVAYLLEFIVSHGAPSMELGSSQPAAPSLHSNLVFKKSLFCVFQSFWLPPLSPTPTLLSAFSPAAFCGATSECPLART